MSAVVKAFQLAEEMNASQQHFMQILGYGKEQYCKGSGTCISERFWPNSWESATAMLRNKGCQDPEDYFVCLDNNHPCSYDIFKDPKSACKHCGNDMSLCIKYSYLPLRHKIQHWCSSSSFCHRMTAHWRDKETWLQSAATSGSRRTGRKELWDGNCFAELSWF